MPLTTLLCFTTEYYLYCDTGSALITEERYSVIVELLMYKLQCMILREKPLYGTFKHVKCVYSRIAIVYPRGPAERPPKATKRVPAEGLIPLSLSHAKVEGVWQSFSTVILLSLPVAI